MDWRVMMPNQVSSGSEDALPRPRPLRTGHARFRATGSSKPQRLHEQSEVLCPLPLPEIRRWQ
jgi:hypothetical protein